MHVNVFWADYAYPSAQIMFSQMTYSCGTDFAYIIELGIKLCVRLQSEHPLGQSLEFARSQMNNSFKTSP